MYSISLKDIKRLIGKKDGPCISIFVPAIGVRSGIEKNFLRLRRLLKKAEELVPFVDYKKNSINQLLKHLKILSKHAAFIMPKQDGLVLFLSPKILRYYRLYRHQPESLTVSDHFIIDPLLPKEANAHRI